MSSKIQQCGFGNNLDSFYKPGSGDIMYYRKDVLNCLDNINNLSSFGKLNKKINSVIKDEKYIRSL